MQWTSIILSSIFSGLLGVGISTFYHARNEKKKIKILVLEQLLGNRHDLRGERFTEALNKIFITFHDSPEVIQSLKAFHEVIVGPNTNDLANQKLLDLFKAMCKNVDIDPRPLTDNFFLQPFNVKLYQRT